jgi:hypothetical protein
MIFTKRCQEDVVGINGRAPFILNLENYGIRTITQLKSHFEYEVLRQQLVMFISCRIFQYK